MGQARIGFYVLATLHANKVLFIHACSRLIGFGACLLGAAVCFFVAFLTAPLIPIRPAKFALALRSAHVRPRFTSSTAFSSFLCSSLGSVLVMFGFVEYLDPRSLPRRSRSRFSAVSPCWWGLSPTSSTSCPKSGCLFPPPILPAFP